MKIVYFDRNVFADICLLRRTITEDDVALIKRAVDSKLIMIPSSMTLFEETIRVIGETSQDYNEHIKTVFDLIDKEKMIKPLEQILIDDCYSYAEKKAFNRLMMIPSQLKDVLDLSKNREELVEFAEDITYTIKQSANEFTEAFFEAAIIGEERNVGTTKNFLELWESTYITMIEERLNPPIPRQIRKLCKKRGLSKMIEIKSFRLYTIYYAWLTFTSWFGGEQGKQRKVRDGDIGDFHHAVQSSAAEIFVTQESKDKVNRLPYILNQVTTDNYKIMNLFEFIKFLKLFSTTSLDPL